MAEQFVPLTPFLTGFIHFGTPAEVERWCDAMRRVEEYLKGYNGRASLDYVKMFLNDEVGFCIPREFRTAAEAKRAGRSVFRVKDGTVLLPVIEPFPLPAL